MATTTTMQSLPLMQLSDDPNIPEDVGALALAIEKKLVGVYATAADRNSKVTSPVKGQIAFLSDAVAFTFWNGTTWMNLVPSTPTFSSGTNVPSNTVGTDGDVFLKTS